MKKLVYLLLAVCMCLSVGALLTACDEGNDHEHTYGEWSEVKTATCSEKGKREKVCSCGEKVTEDIEALTHTEEIVEGKAATCTEAGLTDGKKCSVCGTITVEQELIGVTAHSFSSEWEHDETYHWHKCTACSEIKDKTTHNWDAGVITTPPTTESGGEKKLTCTDCGETKNEAVPVVQGGKVNSATEWDAAMNYSGNHVCLTDAYREEDGKLCYMGQQVTTHYGNIIKIDNEDFYTKEGDKYYHYRLTVDSDDGGVTYYEIWENRESNSFVFGLFANPFASLAGRFDSFTYNSEDGCYYAEDLTIGATQADMKIKIENGRVVEFISDELYSGMRMLSEYAVEYRDVELTLPSLDKMPHTCSQGYWKECEGDSAETHHIGVCGGCDCEIAGTIAEHTWDSGEDTGDGVIYTCTDCGCTKEEGTT